MGRRAGIADRAHARARNRFERGLEQRSFRAVRFDHRRGIRPHALRRFASAHPEHGHGGEIPRRGRNDHVQRYGLGIQPLSYRSEPVYGSVSRRGGKRGEARCGGFQARSHVSDFPGVLRAPAQRARALGQTRSRGARCSHGADRSGNRIDRRQGFHVGQLRRPRRAAHARKFRHSCGLGRSGHVG